MKKLTDEYKTKRFIEKAQKVHCDENLDYSECFYINNRTPVKIIDHDLRPDGTEYGEYWQMPCKHLEGQGHPDKKGLKISKTKTLARETVIERFMASHFSENLDYSQVEYKGMHTPVKIIDHDLKPDGTEYGEYWQMPYVHINGYGHPEKKRNVVKENFFSTIYQTVSKCSNETVVKNDCIISMENAIGFQCNSLKGGMKQYDLLSLSQKYNEKGITLIHIFEDEFINSKEIVINKIQHILHNDNNPKIYARNCVVREVYDKKITALFMKKNHIQGDVGNTVAIGCFYDDKLCGLMTFAKTEKENGWILNRYCTDINFKCIGVASKLFKYFCTKYNPYEVKSFLDRRWCFNNKENVYTKLGFIEDKILPPDYHYSKNGGQRIHKFNFRKQKLHKKYGFPLTMTETEMVKELGYDRIWDCGLIKYVWTNKEENK